MECVGDTVHHLLPTRINEEAAEVTRGGKCSDRNMETFLLPDRVHAVASAFGCHVVLVLRVPLEVAW